MAAVAPRRRSFLDRFAIGFGAHSLQLGCAFFNPPKHQFGIEHLLGTSSCNDDDYFNLVYLSLVLAWSAGLLHPSLRFEVSLSIIFSSWRC
jgi:hypothetical protein